LFGHKGVLSPLQQSRYDYIQRVWKILILHGKFWLYLPPKFHIFSYYLLTICIGEAIHIIFICTYVYVHETCAHQKRMYMKLVNFVKVIDSFNVYSNILMLKCINFVYFTTTQYINFVIKEYFGLLLK
jgi:hypothetical protein